MCGQAQTLQRHILGRFVDASLDRFRIFKFRPLGGDEAKHNLLITGNLSQWRKVTGTVVVELQIVGVHVLFAKQLGCDRSVTAG